MATIKDSSEVLRPKKTKALKALREIQLAFQRSGIPEEQLQHVGRHVRRKVAGERCGDRA